MEENSQPPGMMLCDRDIRKGTHEKECPKKMCTLIRQTLFRDYSEALLDPGVFLMKANAHVGNYFFFDKPKFSDSRSQEEYKLGMVVIDAVSADW